MYFITRLSILVFILLAFVGPVAAGAAGYPRHPCQDVPDNPKRWCDGFDGLDVSGKDWSGLIPLEALTEEARHGPMRCWVVGLGRMASRE
ncbi:hypothetical protein MGG_01366 [Pyricularia oryzae 70-15]|uniref:Uncharacterized protein n=1 Tax=Pyricularia oryzae (strain 70-15 / ATCC MYA-4617 / FGSC 8958) TaxID=242507 RepID=G4MZ27_PYRO7|nr:uncharacterized protein MGG_01366 [Pyricularia oryzae 70-15]EHA54494.1 hypothetical protein MGG_01366 [Pyricularia oryzae 70-15]